MTALLDQLSGPPRSVTDMADILEKHIGDGADPRLCTEVIDALKRARKRNASYSVRVSLRMLDDAAAPCHCVRKIIGKLRSLRYFSGA